tara:strand:- start:1009 stop:1284 length:276 start_codon:yes stop_codon:yes gene_type:complete
MPARNKKEYYKIYDNEDDDMIVIPSLVNRLNKNAEKYRNLWIKQLEEENRLHKEISYLKSSWNEALKKIDELEKEIDYLRKITKEFEFESE